MKEKIATWLAWKLPRVVVYWAAIRLLTYKNGNGPGSEIIDALKRWET